VNLNQNIFRANDIRGVAFEDLNEEVVFNLGKGSWIRIFNKKRDQIHNW